MLEKINGDCWFGIVDEFKSISSTDTEESRLAKILCECQNGDFSNVDNILDIAINSTDSDIWEGCFKLFMCVSSHEQIKNNIEKINQLLDIASKDDSDLEIVSNLSQHILLSFSGEILSKKCNFIKFYYDLADTDLVDSILLSIEFMLDAQIYEGFDDIDDVLSNIPAYYLLDGVELEINAIAQDLLDNIDEIEEEICILLSMVSGIEHPNFEDENIDVTKTTTEFLNSILVKNFVKGKKYFYGYEVK